MKKILMAVLAFGMSSAANATDSISFGAPSGNVGTTETYTSAGGLTVTASGYDAAGGATDLYGKNQSGDEVGLGLANDPTGQHEIYYGSGFVQIDVSALFGLVSDVRFFTNSTSSGEQWSVFGSNTDGSYSGAALLSGTTEASSSLPGLGTYDYYDFVSTANAGGKNFLVSGLTLTQAVPEPATWAMMLLGFGAVGAGMRRRTRRTALQVA